MTRGQLLREMTKIAVDEQNKQLGKEDARLLRNDLRTRYHAEKQPQSQPAIGPQNTIAK